MAVRTSFLNGMSGLDFRDTLNDMKGRFGRMTRNPFKVSIGAGDSRHELFGASSADPARITHKSFQHPLTIAMAIMDQCFEVDYNGGMSGQPSGVYLNTNSRHTTRFPNTNNAVASLSTDALYLYMGGAFICNDFDTTKGNTDADGAWFGYTSGGIGIKQYLQMAIAAGMIIILCTDPGAANMGVTNVGQVHKFNRYLRDFAKNNPSVIFIDYAAVFWDPTNTDDTKIKFKAGYSGDQVHPITLGSYALAQEVKRVAGPRFHAIPRLPTSVADNSVRNNNQLAKLPLFSPLSVTPGAVQGFTYTGQFPAGLSFYHQINGTNATSGNPGGTATAQMVDDPNGFGKACEIVVAGSVVGEQFGVSLPIEVANLTTAGSTIEALLRVALSDIVGMNIRFMRVSYAPDGGSQVVLYDGFADSGQGAAYGAIPSIPDLTFGIKAAVPAYTTSINLAVTFGLCTVAANASGKFRISQFTAPRERG